MNTNSEVNAITPPYITILDFKICPIIIKAQKINGFFFKAFEMIIISFHVFNKLGKACFF